MRGWLVVWAVRIRDWRMEEFDEALSGGGEWPDVWYVKQLCVYNQGKPITAPFRQAACCFLYAVAISCSCCEDVGVHTRLQAQSTTYAHLFCQ